MADKATLSGAKMPPKRKSKAKAFNTPAKKFTEVSPDDPPAPFQRPPSNLEPFLAKLTKGHVYITHIDTKPRDFKRKIFFVPVLMNLSIIACLVWRVTVIGPFYMKICFSLMGRFNETTMDTAHLPWSGIVRETLRRTVIFMIDLMLYVLVWPWPRDFFVGRAIGNPIAWRFGVGFRDNEIIVRRSRRWIQSIGNVLEEGPGRDLLFSNVQKAVDPIWMNEKTGYLMLNKEWDLDWKAMVQATKMVDKKIIALEYFKTTILVHNKEFGWMIETPSAGTATEEEGRKKIIAFKEELTTIGKENLFFRWIELVQFESSQPEGWGPEQQMKTMAKAKELFEEQGINFDEFWVKVGGMQGMPGMDGL